LNGGKAHKLADSTLHLRWIENARSARRGCRWSGAARRHAGHEPRANLQR